jgi:hypothetical protein
MIIPSFVKIAHVVILASEVQQNMQWPEVMKGSTDIKTHYQLDKQA